MAWARLISGEQMYFQALSPSHEIITRQTDWNATKSNIYAKVNVYLVYGSL